MKTFENFIGEQWLAPTTGDYSENRNPANHQEVLGRFPLSSEGDVDDAIDAAHRAFDGWAATPAPQRGALLYRLADLLERNAEDLGRILTLEQGKAIRESVGEVKRAAQEARYMAGEASRLTGTTLPSENPNQWIHHVREPAGVIAAITPWNFPVVTPVRKIAPALACGDTVVFKPASETPWSAVRLVELLQEAGAPAGVVNLVMGSGRTVGDRIANSTRIAGITFTGSTEVGQRIYASAARSLARVQLELGGKNAAIVIDPYDLRRAAQAIVGAAFTCSGQRCTAVSRVIVDRASAAALVAEIIGVVEGIRVDDGLVPDTVMGPLVSQAQLEQVERYVDIARSEGARIVTGGTRLHEDRQGYYYAPTVVTGVSPTSVLATEEIFGPVLPVIECDGVEEAAGLCNATPFGLAAVVFTRDMQTAMTLANRAKVGMVHVNHGTASQAHVPFGGVKASGQGAYSIGATAKDFYMVEKVIYLQGS